MDEFQVQIMGEICWLFPGDNEKERFPPGIPFKAFVKFTSDFTPSFTAVINYFPTERHGIDHHYSVRLCFPFAIEEEISRLSLRTEIIILDAYKVIAICSNIIYMTQCKKKMGDLWI